MRKFGILGILMLLAFSSAGCSTMKTNSYEINQLKSQMVTIENALARQNLYIQQNRTETADLFDRSEEISMQVSRVKQNQKIASVTRGGSYDVVGIQKVTEMSTGTTTSSVISDKIVSPPSLPEVQKSLRNAGFYIGSVDGKVGPMTRAAITKFQKANALNADGIVGNQTWAKLKDYL